MFVGVRTPLEACTKELLPGLTTHRAVKCTLQLAPGYLVPPDTRGSILKFKEVAPDRIVVAAVVASLALWWARAAQLSPDDTFKVYWKFTASVLQPAQVAPQISPESAKKLLESGREAPLEGDAETARWWRER